MSLFKVTGESSRSQIPAKDPVIPHGGQKDLGRIKPILRNSTPQVDQLDSVMGIYQQQKTQMHKNPADLDNDQTPHPFEKEIYEITDENKRKNTPKRTVSEEGKAVELEDGEIVQLERRVIIDVPVAMPRTMEEALGKLKNMRNSLIQVEEDSKKVCATLYMEINEQRRDIFAQQRAINDLKARERTCREKIEKAETRYASLKKEVAKEDKNLREAREKIGKEEAAFNSRKRKLDEATKKFQEERAKFYSEKKEQQGQLEKTLKMQSTYQRKKAKLKEKKKAFASKEKELETTAGNIKSRESELSSKESRASEREGLLQKKNTELEAKASLLGTMEIELNQKEGKLADERCVFYEEKAKLEAESKAFEAKKKGWESLQQEFAVLAERFKTTMQ